MEVVNATIYYYGVFKEVMLFIRPAVIIVLVLASIFEVFIYYVQYKYNIFTKKLTDEIEYYDVYNDTDETRMARAFWGNIISVLPLLYIMCKDIFGGIFQAPAVFFGLIDIMLILNFTYKVFSPYWKQART
jgi:hypothetical protein